MTKLYLVTGATGHLGTVLLEKLLERNEKVRVLTLPNEKDLLKEKDVDIFLGDVTDKDSMEAFFDVDMYDFVTLIHAAALISIGSKANPMLWEVNVKGASNVMELALKHQVDRVIYVSSVHAIPEKEPGQLITEVDEFSKDLVVGQYAKTKAEAAQMVLDFAKRGLNVSIVHPSGMIGPGDIHDKNHSVRTIKAMKKGRIFVSIAGGYDFVDSRDVVDGILACETKGKKGQCYLLTGNYISITELLNSVRKLDGKRPIHIQVPYGIIKAFSPIGEWVANLFGRMHTIYTPYSVAALHSNSNFSHEKASKELGYQPRPILETIKASLS